MQLPTNISLPFLAYGIFKPGELSYCSIRDFVEKNEVTKIPGLLQERDGIPLLELHNEYAIEGYLLHFVAGHQDDAYNAIMDVEPSQVYKWAVIEINKVNANVLVGKDSALKKGAQHIEHATVWNGKDDPCFKYGLNEVRRVLNDARSGTSGPGNKERYVELFRLQMAYMLLWSIIERFITLKYYLRIAKNVEKVKRDKFAGDQAFQDALRKHVGTDRIGSEVFSSKDVGESAERLDPDDPIGSYEYYRLLRNNIVHRGKAFDGDLRRITVSLDELLKIFGDVKDASFNQAAL